MAVRPDNHEAKHIYIWKKCC